MSTQPVLSGGKDGQEAPGGAGRGRGGVVAVPAGLVVGNEAAAAEREAAERSLERAAEEVLQRVADAPGAQWRTYAPPGGDVRNHADARDLVRRAGRKRTRFAVDVDGITAPCAPNTYGRGLWPTVPRVGQHRFVFERDGSDWRLARDLTAQR
ncbi:hypothetical protein [Streptomyces sp. NPDC096153]|uniref:hypothetical protein n=1 Tax=Streptomyces sp. NPDC096153 TaxID=3155548 RepID=UPI00333324D2